MKWNILVPFILTFVHSASTTCTTEGISNVFRICENANGSFLALRGNLWISSDDMEDLLSCNCSLNTVTEHPSLLILTHTGHQGIPVNYSITHENKLLTENAETHIFTANLNGSDPAMIVIQRRPDYVGNERGHFCFGFQAVKPSLNISIVCRASFISQPETTPEETEERGASLGVILGPTITVFILLNIATIALVYYIMKRRMKRTARWRPRIEHTVNHMKEPSVASDDHDYHGNNYVGIRSKSRKERGQEAPVGEEYEAVERPNIVPQMEIILPQKASKPWFFFRKGRTSVYSKAKEIKQPEEYEDVQPSTVETVKEKLMTSAGNYVPEEYENVNKLGDQFGNKKNTPKRAGKGVTPVESSAVSKSRQKLNAVSDVNWTPADTYEDVQVKTTPTADGKKVNTGFVPKDSYETMEDLRSAKGKKMPQNTVAASAAKSGGNLKPTECYEDMHPPTKKSAQKTQGGSEKFRTDSKKPPQAPKASSPQGQIPNTTYDNMESWTKQQSQRKQGKKTDTPPSSSTEGRDKAGIRPTETYDNVEVMNKHSTSRTRGVSEKRGTKSQPQNRPRFQTEPPDPSQVYDNFDQIAEMRRIARAGSRTTNVKKS